jgi:hypothetical protein
MTVINNFLLLKCEGNSTISTVKLQKASTLLKKRGPEHCPQKKGIARGSRKTKNKGKKLPIGNKTCLPRCESSSTTRKAISCSHESKYPKREKNNY